MSDIDVARDFFRAYLPPEIKKDLEINSITFDRCNTSIVREKTHKREIADVVFKARLLDMLAYLIAHIEHQSTCDMKVAYIIVSQR